MKDRGICRDTCIFSCYMAVRWMHARHQDRGKAREGGNPKRYKKNSQSPTEIECSASPCRWVRRTCLFVNNSGPRVAVL